MHTYVHRERMCVRTNMRKYTLTNILRLCVVTLSSIYLTVFLFPIFPSSKSAFPNPKYMSSSLASPIVLNHITSKNIFLCV